MSAGGSPQTGGGSPMEYGNINQMQPPQTGGGQPFEYINQAPQPMTGGGSPTTGDPMQQRVAYGGAQRFPQSGVQPPAASNSYMPGSYRPGTTPMQPAGGGGSKGGGNMNNVSQFLQNYRPSGGMTGYRPATGGGSPFTGSSSPTLPNPTGGTSPFGASTSAPGYRPPASTATWGTTQGSSPIITGTPGGSYGMGNVNPNDIRQGDPRLGGGTVDSNTWQNNYWVPWLQQQQQTRNLTTGADGRVNLWDQMNGAGGGLNGISSHADWAVAGGQAPGAAQNFTGQGQDGNYYINGHLFGGTDSRQSFLNYWNRGIPGQ